MGKGTIAGGGSEGLYTLGLDFGKARRDAAVAKLDAAVAKLDDEMVTQQALLDGELAKEATVTAALNAAIAVYAELAEVSPVNDAAKQAQKAVDDATEALFKQKGRTAEVRIPLDRMKADRAAAVNEKRALLGVVVESTQQAWCVDLTENATGVVATIEVPGEPQAVLIAPGARAPVSGDGQLMARGVMTPAQAFFNAAILPGWQKFYPTYRKGTITALDKVGNTADVQLDGAVSTAQGLPVNQAGALLAVTVEYMSCHASAFEVGDRCVVQFEGQDWVNPKVIGFVDHPKACHPTLTLSDGSVAFDSPFYTRGVHMAASGSTFAWWDHPSVEVSINGEVANKIYTTPFGLAGLPPEFIGFSIGSTETLEAWNSYFELGLHRSHNLTAVRLLAPVFYPPNPAYPDDRTQFFSLKVKRGSSVLLDADFSITLTLVGGGFSHRLLVANKVKHRMLRPATFLGDALEVV